MNYIILEKSSSLRAKAREDLKGKWLFAIGVMIIANICTVFIPTVIQSLTDIKVYFFGLDSIFMQLVSGPINLGIALYFLGSRRGKSKSPLTIFEGFRKYFKVLGLYICIMVIVLLWSFLMVVPGVIAAFRYSMAYNVLVDHPEYTIKQCLDESKRIMDGNIGKLFLINL